MQRGLRGTILAGSPHRGASVAGRKRTEIDDSSYSGRLALRLRKLREDRGWTVDQLQKQLQAAGQKVPASSIYAYESGRLGGGADLPCDLYPVYAAAFGLTVRMLLPAR